MAPKKKPEADLKNQRIPIMMTEAELKSIDDWRFSNRIASRGEAIRRLGQIGIFVTSDDILVGPALNVVELAERFEQFSQRRNVDPERLVQLGKAVAAAALIMATGTIPVGVKAHAFATGATFEDALADIEKTLPHLRFREAEMEELRNLVDDELARSVELSRNGEKKL